MIFFPMTCGSLPQICGKERDPEKRTEALDAIDTEAVTRRLMELLDIRNKEEQSIGITTAHIIEIKQYLAALELIVVVPLNRRTPELNQWNIFSSHSLECDIVRLRHLSIPC